MNDIQTSDEIDLIQLIETIWDGKWKIIAITVACVLGVFGFQFISPAPSFVATTEIKPISSMEVNEYASFNSLEFYKITKEDLLSIYNERLTYHDTLVKTFNDIGLLDREEFDSEGQYNLALRAMAGRVILLPPVNVDGKERGEQRPNWTLSMKYTDKDKWLLALQQLNDIATREVLEINKRKFELLVETEKLAKSFAVDDLDIAIENTKKDFDKKMEEFDQKKTFELEDLDTAIDNAVKDYDRKTSDRLAFLREQAAIARKLGVSKNTIEAQTFSTQTGVLTNVKTDTPFYLRGYEAIEKEIELILSRDYKEPFINGLLELEQKKRALEQDKTLERVALNKVFLKDTLELERKKRALEQDKTLQRVDALFVKTPLAKPGEFRAAMLAVETTQFQYKSKSALMLVLAAVFGGMIGVVYVLIASAMRGRREVEAVRAK